MILYILNKLIIWFAYSFAYWGYYTLQVTVRLERPVFTCDTCTTSSLHSMFPPRKSTLVSRCISSFFLPFFGLIYLCFFSVIHSFISFTHHSVTITIQYNFIAKCQYTDCTRNVLWCQVHSSHIHSNHKTFNYNSK